MVRFNETSFTLTEGKHFVRAITIGYSDTIEQLMGGH